MIMTALGIARGAWAFLGSRIGQIALASGIAFYGGYAVKAKLDRSVTLQAVIAKQRIDLQAAEQKAANDAATIDGLQSTDTFNQELLRELAQKPGACVLDDAAARGLRGLR